MNLNYRTICSRQVVVIVVLGIPIMMDLMIKKLKDSSQGTHHLIIIWSNGTMDDGIVTARWDMER